jgi:hypothetical protein
MAEQSESVNNVVVLTHRKDVNNSVLKDGACIRTPPQLRISRKTHGFGFAV